MASPLMVFTSWFHGRCVKWDDMENGGFHKIMAYFPDNLVNLAHVPNEVHVTNHLSILFTILTVVK
uniref:Uncharacterized protein n=1 Tax=Oryza meridionalis TaxID=40149 RepID=A0A0E0EM01_9ORYZ